MRSSRSSVSAGSNEFARIFTRTSSPVPFTVTVTVNGTGELVRVKIRANSFDPADTEDLEDLIIAAYRDAKARSEQMASEAFGPIAGGLGALGGDMSGGPASGGPLGF